MTETQDRFQAAENALLDLARAVRSMIEDGHPDDVQWFEIMQRRLAAFTALVDIDQRE